MTKTGGIDNGSEYYLDPPLRDEFSRRDFW
jgi:hypothetical protein